MGCGLTIIKVEHILSWQKHLQKSATWCLEDPRGNEGGHTYDDHHTIPWNGPYSR